VTVRMAPTYQPKAWHLVVVALIVLFDLVVLYMVLKPNVTNDYRAYYIDRSSSCFPRADNVATGDGAVAIGNLSSAIGQGSVAIGNVAIAGTNGVAVGNGASNGGFANSVAVGAKAPASATPTLASTHGAVSQLTTRVPPDRDLLRYSIASSLAAHKPFVVTFATPRFCTSRTCGPVVDVVDYVRRKYAARGVRFIHVEVFKQNRPALGYNRWMRQWGLQSEPWTFLVGRDGRIEAKFEGSVSAAELEAAIRRSLL